LVVVGVVVQMVVEVARVVVLEGPVVVGVVLLVLVNVVVILWSHLTWKGYISQYEQ
jgi:hypothetical protein